MNAPAVLASTHTSDRWSVHPDGGHALLSTGPGSPELDFGADSELADFVAAAPKMARALRAVLNLDLGTEAERLLRSEINACLR